MAKIYDITSKITNDLPVLKITDEIVVTINNRKNNILCIQAMANENENKEEADRMGDEELIGKSMRMLVGDASADRIEALDLPVNEYRAIYDAMLEIALTGELSDTPSKE